MRNEMSAPERVPGRSSTTAQGSAMAAQPAPPARRSRPRATAAAETPGHPHGIDVHGRAGTPTKIQSFSNTLLREDLKEARMARLIYSAIMSLDNYTADAE